MKRYQLIFMIGIALIYSQLVFSTEISKKPAILTARGIIYHAPYRAQENTLDAILAIKKWNKDHPTEQLAGSEIHVVVVKPKNPEDPPIFVCSHDENLIDLTGQNINLRDLSKEQIQNLNLLQVLDGVDYGKTRHFAFLEDVIKAVMQDKPFILWLGVKEHSYRPSPNEPSYTATELVKALITWRNEILRKQNIDLFKYLMVSSTNAFMTQQLVIAAKTYHANGLEILPDYSDYILPPIIWQQFFAYGGYEKAFDFSPHWVSLQDTLVTKQLVTQYHKNGTKIICWGGCNDPQTANQFDMLLGSY